MNKNTKGILTVLGIGAIVYVAYKLLKGESILRNLPPFNQMREELWQAQVAKNPALSTLKDVYFNTESWKDTEFISEWYNAQKKGKDVFKYKGRTWSTKTGLGV